MPGDNVDVTPQEKGTVASTSLDARDAVKLPTRLRTVPHSKEFSGSRINKDKAEKPAPADNWGEKSLIKSGGKHSPFRITHAVISYHCR